ncbi:MAG: alkaline phosphatase family protein [Christensenellales bacterium]|jgi:predicted AlkP superfamily pyrophosphatase or phosphodiesterase
MKHKLIVISADAMVDADLDILSKLPNTRALLERASIVRRVRTIYPTVTYPAHTSMMTGVYPNRHGVISNEDLTVGAPEQPWCWFNRSSKVKDIFHAAKAAGLTTAGVFWPVTGGHAAIDHLIAEYWPQHEGDTLIDAFRRAGSSEDVIEKIIRPNIQGAQMRMHPDSDAMGARFAVDMIREYQPDLLMFHPANIDGMRHRYGLFNEHVTAALEDTDRWLGDIVRATQDAGVYERTNFVLMSDHGQMNIERVIHLNVILADHGLIRVDDHGNVTSWDAFMHSAGMCNLVFLRPGADDALRARLHELLVHLKDEGIYGVSEVFTRAEIASRERLDGDFDFVLETDGYTSFGQRVVRPLVSTFDQSDYRYGHATHGYLPDKGPQPVFIAAGPAIKPGIEIDRRPIVDMPCTMARMLGFALPDADGTAIEAFLR